MADLEPALLAPFGARQRAIIEAAHEWGYFDGGVTCESTVYAGRNVLDIGMGGGPHAVVFVVCGAAGYVGVDPEVGTDMVTDFRSMHDPAFPNYAKFPYSPDEIMAAFPTIRLYSGYVEDMVDRLKGSKLDLITLSYVSEHLMDPERVLAATHEVAADGAALWLCHGNYYSWTGHHLDPRGVEEWKRGDPEEDRNVDWRHLEPSHPANAAKSLNRMRLDELRALIDKYFEIVEWREFLDAVERMTPEIRRRWKRYTLNELLARAVYVYAIRRATPKRIDLSRLIFSRPPESYRAGEDHSSESDEHIKTSNLVCFERPRLIDSHDYNNSAGGRLLSGMKPGDKIVVRKLDKTLTLTIEIPFENSARFVEEIPEECYGANSQEWTIVDRIAKSRPTWREALFGRRAPVS